MFLWAEWFQESCAESCDQHLPGQLEKRRSTVKSANDCAFTFDICVFEWVSVLFCFILQISALCILIRRPPPFLREEIWGGTWNLELAWSLLHCHSDEVNVIIISPLLWSGVLDFVKNNGDYFLSWKGIQRLIALLVHYSGGKLIAYLENSNKGKREPSDK